MVKIPFRRSHFTSRTEENQIAISKNTGIPLGCKFWLFSIWCTWRSEHNIFWMKHSRWVPLEEKLALELFSVLQNYPRCNGCDECWWGSDTTSPSFQFISGLRSEWLRQLHPQQNLMKHLCKGATKKGGGRQCVVFFFREGECGG